MARNIYKELIEINTSVTTGNITIGALAMAKHFRAAGIPASDIFVGGPRPERHNLVVRLRGRNPAGRKPVLLLAHLDVVEGATAITTGALSLTTRRWRRSSLRMSFG